jgi:hypothetical protein
MATAPGNYSLTFNRATNSGLQWLHPTFTVSEADVNKWITFSMNVQNTCASNSNLTVEIYVTQESKTASTLYLRDIKFISPYVRGAEGAIDDGVLVMDGEWFERYSYSIAEGNGGTIAPLEDNVYGAAVTFNAHSSSSYPNFQCRLNKVPKTETLRTLVFDIKTSVELPLSFVFPKDYNWSSKTLLYKVVPAADDWQTIYIDLTGTPVEKGALYNQIYIYHRYQNGDVAEYPEVSFEMSKQILTRLGYDERFIKRVAYLVETHDTIIDPNNLDNRLEMVQKRLQLQYADARAHHPDKIQKRVNFLDDIKKRLQKLEKDER